MGTGVSPCTATVQPTIVFELVDNALKLFNIKDAGFWDERED